VTDWAAFGAVSVTIAVLVLLFARATQSVLESGSGALGSDREELESDRQEVKSDRQEVKSDRQASDSAGTDTELRSRVADEEATLDDERGTHPTADPSASPLDAMSTGMLLLNVVATQAVFLLLLLGGIWYTDVPLGSLGVAVPAAWEVLVGAGSGVVLFGLNQAAAKVGREVGLGGDEALREALVPETVPGWVVLLVVVLPVVAGFEELLFRGALVGGFAAGFGLSATLLVVGSSAAFALGHGAQGRVGVVVTGGLGLVFGGLFVATGSLTVVVVAHYLVNTLEFVVCEGIRG
jgi:membrane protease YdiL (CAAX protease family)